jgi:hypothetical protein
MSVEVDNLCLALRTSGSFLAIITTSMVCVRVSCQITLYLGRVFTDPTPIHHDDVLELLGKIHNSLIVNPDFRKKIIVIKSALTRYKIGLTRYKIGLTRYKIGPNRYKISRLKMLVIAVKKEYNVYCQGVKSNANGPFFPFSVQSSIQSPKA